MSLSDHLSQTLLEARDLEAENQQLRQRAEAAERERDRYRRERDRYKRLATRWRKQAYYSKLEAKSYREWGRQIRNGDIDPRRVGPEGPW